MNFFHQSAEPSAGKLKKLYSKMGKIGEIQRGAFEKIIVTLLEPKGKQRIDIRVYSLSDQGEPDNWLASKKGINIYVNECAEFRALVDKVDQAIKGT